MVSDEGADRVHSDSLHHGLEPVPDAVGVPEGQGWRPVMQGVCSLFRQIIQVVLDRLIPFFCFYIVWR